jgi:hypothetical protein
MPRPYGEPITQDQSLVVVLGGGISSQAITYPSPGDGYIAPSPHGGEGADTPPSGEGQGEGEICPRVITCPPARLPVYRPAAALRQGHLGCAARRSGVAGGVGAGGLAGAVALRRGGDKERGRGGDCLLVSPSPGLLVSKEGERGRFVTYLDRFLT